MATKDWYTAIINTPHETITTRGVWIEATTAKEAAETIEGWLSNDEYVIFLANGKLIDELGQVGMEVCDDA